MKTLYISGTDPEERKRIEKLELMDEWEEWNIMQSHYLVSLACKNDDDLIIHLIVWKYIINLSINYLISKEENT